MITTQCVGAGVGVDYCGRGVIGEIIRGMAGEAVSLKMSGITVTGMVGREYSLITWFFNKNLDSIMKRLLVNGWNVYPIKKLDWKIQIKHNKTFAIGTISHTVIPEQQLSVTCSSSTTCSYDYYLSSNHHT
ncbi:hypothetical protein Tco_0784037 [Tanacetum coccineum]